MRSEPRRNRRQSHPSGVAGLQVSPGLSCILPRDAIRLSTCEEETLEGRSNLPPTIEQNARVGIYSDYLAIVRKPSKHMEGGMHALARKPP